MLRPYVCSALVKQLREGGHSGGMRGHFILDAHLHVMHSTRSVGFKFPCASSG